MAGEEAPLPVDRQWETRHGDHYLRVSPLFSRKDGSGWACNPRPRWSGGSRITGCCRPDWDQGGRATSSQRKAISSPAACLSDLFRLPQGGIVELTTPISQRFFKPAYPPT